MRRIVFGSWFQVLKTGLRSKMNFNVQLVQLVWLVVELVKKKLLIFLCDSLSSILFLVSLSRWLKTIRSVTHLFEHGTEPTDFWGGKRPGPV